jgi:hypothetical protein
MGKIKLINKLGNLLFLFYLILYPDEVQNIEYRRKYRIMDFIYN